MKIRKKKKIKLETVNDEHASCNYCTWKEGANYCLCHKSKIRNMARRRCDYWRKATWKDHADKITTD